LKKAIAKGSQLEKQSALFMLSNIGSAEADKLLLSVMRALVAGKVYPAVRLDIVEAARKREAANLLIKELSDEYVASWDPSDLLAPYRDALVGGDASRGEMLYQQRVSLQCVRCHVINGEGGQVGPDISKIAATKTREELMESIVVPNRTIAKGYETMVLELDSGKTVTGIVQKKSEETLVLRTSDGELVTVELDSIEESRQGNSSMPDNLIDQLSSFDLRDLIEYLSQLK
jgi:quinoprotein glucose dehydrogenase